MGAEVAGEFEECLVHFGSPFPANAQAAEAVQSGEGPLNRPPVGAQPGAVPRRATAGTMLRALRPGHGRRRGRGDAMLAGDQVMFRAGPDVSARFSSGSCQQTR